MGWDATRQFQEGLKPGQLALAEEFDMDPGIGAADRGANGDDNDVHQMMSTNWWRRVRSTLGSSKSAK